MKSNPYVGSFRHAPPTSFSSIDGDVLSSSFLLRSLTMKRSPYVGWFRHAPPSKLQLHKVDKDHLALLERCHHLARILESLPPNSRDISNPRLADIISGHLRGGGKGQKYGSSCNRPLVDSICQTLKDTSTESSSATVKVLARLGAWFLFPLAYDMESCGYKHSDGDKMLTLFGSEHVKSSSFDSDDDSVASSACTASECGEDDESKSTVWSNYDECLPVQPIKKPLDISVSDVAEAYYAHQAAEELGFDDRVERLDYVITQMDIARMARNASRHLDVESILSLPSITYRGATNAESTTPPSMTESREKGWSWMIVPEGQIGEQILDTSEGSLSTADESADVCVICLEHFIDGDRLRVLPCNHSFHVGCIDRWLSGSHSYEECVTSGCPTCKKRPNFFQNSTSDGSVPSWAFTQLGDALARASSTLSA